ncbi:MAG: HPr family phosphocarrier protein [Propionibacteriaceae bacterium]|jgi:phosphocarrier protein|nr:HPr family phosphocarrier protein [Propionibacteriaceae bacterium]
MERTVVVAAAEGLHARPAAVFVKAAAAQPAKVRIGVAGSDKRVAAESILAVMSLGVDGGASVVIESESPQALDALEKVLTDPDL